MSPTRRLLAPIVPGDGGDSVANLHSALRILVERGLIRAEAAPAYPGPEALRELVRSLGDEGDEPGPEFGEATLRLVLMFKNQHGIGDIGDEVVDAQTAAALNRALERIDT